MKYKIIKTDLLLNGKIIPENSETDLSESQTKGIENYLEKCLPVGLSAEVLTKEETLVKAGEESQGKSNKKAKNKGDNK